MIWRPSVKPCARSHGEASLKGRKQSHSGDQHDHEWGSPSYGALFDLLKPPMETVGQAPCSVGRPAQSWRPSVKVCARSGDRHNHGGLRSSRVRGRETGTIMRGEAQAMALSSICENLEWRPALKCVACSEDQRQVKGECPGLQGVAIFISFFLVP